MSYQELIALKLQMGINPSAKVAPQVLLAMWQQLKLENEKTRCNPSNGSLIRIK